MIANRSLNYALMMLLAFFMLNAGSALPADSQSAAAATSSTPGLSSPKITAHNAKQLMLTAQLGTGWGSSIAWSPDGQILGVGGSTGVFLYTVTSLSMPPRLLPASEVDHLAFSPDGAMLAAYSEDGTLTLWDLPQGQTRVAIKTTPGWGLYTKIAFSPRTPLLATSGVENVVRLWRTADGNPITPLDIGQTVTCLAFNHDGTVLAIGDTDGGLHVWDMETGRKRSYWHDQTQAITSIDFVPDDMELISASEDGTVRTWNMGTGVSRLFAQKTAPAVSTATLSANGKLAAIWTRPPATFYATDNIGSLRLWNASSRRLNMTLQTQTSSAIGAAFSPDSRLLASIHWDNQVRIWDTRTGQLTALIDRGHSGSAAETYTPDMKLITSGSEGTLRQWDIVTGKARALSKGSQGQVWIGQYSPDGKTYYTDDESGHVRLWDRRTHRQYRMMMVPWDSLYETGYTRESVPLVILPSYEDTIRIYSLATGSLVMEMPGHSSMMIGLQLSHDGSLLASAGSEGTVKLWDMKAEALRWVAPIGDSLIYGAFKFSPDGGYLAFENTTEINVWNLQTGIELTKLEAPGTEFKSYDWSPDSHWLVTSSEDRTIRVWDVNTGKQRTRIDVDNIVYSVRFSPDGSMVVGSYIYLTDEVRLWDAGSGAFLTALPGTTVTFRQDNLQLTTGGSDGIVRLWEVR